VIDILEIRIGVITSTFWGPGEIILARFLEFLTPLSNEIDIITGGDITGMCNKSGISYWYTTSSHENKKINRIINAFLVQLNSAYYVVKFSHKKEIFITIIGENLFLPTLILKLMKKKNILFITINNFQISRERNDVLSYIFTKITYWCADTLVIPNDSIIESFALKNYSQKITVLNRHYIDLTKYGPKKMIKDREMIVGYIGRLSEEKGVMHFVNCIPRVLQKLSTVQFLIVGDGNLMPNIKRFVEEHQLENNVRILGWVPHNDVLNILDNLKLLVIPSITEIGPWVALEAVACQTPILATPVGLIPSLIFENETGFIIRDASPESIAKDVVTALTTSDDILDKMSREARIILGQNYTYPGILNNMQKLLIDELGDCKDITRMET